MATSSVTKKQDEKLLAHLQRYKAIQADYASSVFRIYNLPQRIAKLRRAGHTIITERTTKEQCRYRYIRDNTKPDSETTNHIGHQTDRLPAQPTAISIQG